MTTFLNIYTFSSRLTSEATREYLLLAGLLAFMGFLLIEQSLIVGSCRVLSRLFVRTVASLSFKSRVVKRGVW